MTGPGARGPGQWRPPVLRAVATAGEGVDELVAALDDHHASTSSSGALVQRRRRRAASEVEAIAVTALRQRLGDVRGGRLLDDLAEEVVAGRCDPYSAADRLLASLSP